MSHGSDDSREIPRVVGDRPESHASKEATDRTEESLSNDELVSILANRRRRFVLHCLETSETPMALADLADELVRWETDRSPTEVQDERERIYVSLYHCHIPKLAESGLVSFDMNRNLVDLRADTDELPLDAVRTSAKEHLR